MSIFSFVNAKKAAQPLSRALAKAENSGLVRLLERANSDLTKFEMDGSELTIAIKNRAGQAVLNLDVNHLASLAPCFTSAPRKEVFDLVKSNPWFFNFDRKSGVPLALLPVCAVIWKVVGFGQEIVKFAREQDYNVKRDVDRLHEELGAIAVMFGVLDQRSKDDLHLSIAGMAEPRSHAFINWFRNEWKMEGTTLHVREEVKRLRGRVKLTPNQVLLQAAFFCDAGEYGYALDLAKQAEVMRPGIWHQHRIPAVTRLLYREGLLNAPWALEDAELCDEIEGSDNFERSVRSNRNSFAIVGNGPTQIGRGTGNVIDSKNVVVRINNGGRSRDAHSIDYGRKQTVWLRSLQNYDIRRVHKIEGINVVLISGSSPIYRLANCAEFLKEIRRVYGIINVVPEEYLRSAIQAIGTNPSSGIVMLTWAKNIVDRLVDQENVFGFSLNDQKVRQTTHYFRDAPIQSHHTHDWEAERAYFEKIIENGS